MNIGLKTFLKYSGNRPLYDAEIEYLESTGTQWIDTGIYPDNNTQTNCDFMLLRNNTNYDCIAACEGNGVYYWLCARNAGSLDRYILGTSSGTSVVYLTRTFNVRRSVQFNTAGNKLNVDGVNYQLGSVTKRCSNTIGLWCERYSNKADFLSIARIYSVVILDRSTGEILRDMIPVRKGNVGYMYDRVSGKLFGNKGTGSFIVGPDKNK